MSRFKAELPSELVKELTKLEKNVNKITESMVRSAAQVVEKNIILNAPEAVKDSKMIDCLGVTHPYRTPTDGAVNTKVAFYGYFEDKDGRRKPAPLVANVFENGRSNIPFSKHPFIRKSFKKKEIETAMKKTFNDLTGGKLDE